MSAEKDKDEEKIKMLKDFYGIIKPDGTFVKAKYSQKHEELAKDIIIKDFGEDTLNTNNEQDGPKEFLVAKGYVWVSCELKYIRYCKLYPENRWIERQEERLKLLGWNIVKPKIPDWAFEIFSRFDRDV